MRLNKKTQYAILLALYLSRSGRTTIDSAAEGLGASKAFLAQVAASMRRKGLLVSGKGPNGGYALARDNIMIYELIEAFNPTLVLSTPDMERLKYGGAEKRAFRYFVLDYVGLMRPALRMKVSDLLSATAALEVGMLERAVDTGGSN